MIEERQITLEQIASLPVHYELGHDDPGADIRYREQSEKIASDIFTSKQLEYVLSQLKPDENPRKFYVWEMCFQWTGVNVHLILNKDRRECCKKLYGNPKYIDLKEAKFYWEDGDKSDMTLEDWYNRWLHDPWR